MKRYGYLICLAGLILGFIFIGFGQYQESKAYDYNPYALEEEDDDNGDDDAGNGGTENSPSIQEAKLTEEEKDAYDVLYDAVNNYKVSATVEGLDGEQTWELFLKMLDDHPEFFWVNLYGNSTVQNGKNNLFSVAKTTLNFGNKYDNAQIQSMRDQLNKEVSRVVSQAKKYQSEYEQVLFVHDYLVDKTEYDFVVADAIDSGTYKNMITESTTSYGAIIDGKAVCSGYSESFELIMKTLGYECEYVGGVAKQGNHAWNYIKLEDEYYLIDVTWDDPTGGGKNRKTYTYFLLDDETMSRNHTPSQGEYVPKCEGKKYNYYIYNGWYVDAYDLDKVKKMIEDQIASGHDASLRFSTKEYLDKAIEDLMNNREIYSVKGVSGRDFSYSPDDDMYTLDLIFK